MRKLLLNVDRPGVQALPATRAQTTRRLWIHEVSDTMFFLSRMFSGYLHGRNQEPPPVFFGRIKRSCGLVFVALGKSVAPAVVAVLIR